MRPNKYFNGVNEVEEILPRVKLLVSRSTVLLSTVRTLSNIRVNSSSQQLLVGLKKDYYHAQYEYHKVLEEIVKLGGVVERIGEGFVDFASKVNGKKVWLCWRYGEPDVNYYHEKRSDCHRRKRLEILRGLS